jgi:hypothetical protein
MAHGLVLGGIGLDLGAIQCHMAQAHHAGLLAEPQDLHEKLAEGVQVPAAELTDPAVVRLLVTGQHPESQILVAGALNLPGGDDADAVGVEEQQRHHSWVEPLLATGILGASGSQDGREVQLIDQIQQEIHLMVMRKPVGW